MSKFIVFEGLDGAGKSTLIKQVSDKLKQQAISFILTREPGGTSLGETVRDWVLNPKSECSPQTEILLMSAVRHDHIDKVIQPALKAGQWILCDRFWASTSAFQGEGRGLPDTQVQWLNEFTVSKNIQPDLWFLLDLPLEEKEKRTQKRNTVFDTFEKQNRDFHKRVRSAYLKLAHSQKDKWCLLDACLPVERLTQSVMQEITKRQWF